MKEVISKSFLYISGACLLLFMGDVTKADIVSLLVVLIAGAGLDILQEKELFREKTRVFSICIMTVLLACGIFYPKLVVFYPYLCFLFVLYNYKLLTALLGIFFVYCLGEGDRLFLCVSFFLSVCAGLIAYQGNRIQELKEKNRNQRDSSVEHELLMKQVNRQLIENQDVNIYNATLKERNRIAREIHDNVGHMLTRSILQVGAMKVINQQENLKEMISDLSDTLDMAMTSMRNSVHDLHDESVDLKSSMEHLADDLKDFQFSLEYDCENIVPKDIKYAFIAIAKEAVNNVVKYSNGDKMLIIVREHPGFFQLQISDNGTVSWEFKKNLNQGTVFSDGAMGIGLKNMKDRAEALKGNIQFLADHGFTVRVTVMKR